MKKVEKERREKDKMEIEEEKEEMKGIIDQMNQLGMAELKESLLDRAMKDLTSEHDLISVECPSQRSLSNLIHSISNLENIKSFWSFPQQSSISMRHLLVWLKFGIGRWKGQQISEENTLGALECAKLYCFLLGLEGNSAHNLFQPLIFSSLLNFLKMWKLSRIQKTMKEIGEAKNAKRRGKPNNIPNAKRSKGKTIHSQEEDEDQEDQDGGNPFGLKTNEQEKGVPTSLEIIGNIPSDQILSLLKMIQKAIIMNPLTSLDTKTHTTEVIADLTRYHEIQDSVSNKRGRKKQSEEIEENENQSNSEGITKQSYRILGELISSSHGPSQQTFTLILKNLLPNVLMNFEGLLTVGTLPKFMQNIKCQAIQFIVECLENSPKNAEETLFDGVHALLQHVCMQVPDKAEYRNHAANAVEELYFSFPREERPRFLKFLQRFAKNVKSNLRLFSTEVSFALLSSQMDQSDGNQLDSSFPSSSSLLLLEILIQRSSDKIATVRAKAISNIAQLLENATENERLEKEFSSVFERKEESSSLGLISLLRRRVEDEKCGVRKSALQALAVFAKLGSIEAFEEEGDLSLFTSKTRDPAVSIRKQCLESLTQILRNNHQRESVTRAWLKFALPMVMDAEATVQEKVLDLVEELILEPIINFSNKNERKDESIWKLAQLLGETDISRSFQKAISLLGKQKRIKSNILQTLQKNLRDEFNEESSWVILIEVAPHAVNSLDPQTLLNCWEQVKDSTGEKFVLLQQRILRVLELCPNLTQKQSSKVASGLLSRLKSFDLPPSLIQSFITALSQLSRLSFGKDEPKISKERIEEILSICDEELASFVLHEFVSD
eukprot:TRINITY_DN5598_c0_g2_i4.p1 TRINITY_DN5598_c0_g2~~TRINITY_DN5598_c0_g2_i4.p1  ORF type:complete len:837 (+),score=259.64 TRINITY_DN5598_c0_g2_i4:125-2635(+)